MRTRLLACLSLAAFGAALLASSARAAGVGTTGGEFLRIGVGARGLAMSGAMSAMTEDVHSVYWNPAGLARIKEHEAGASYNSLFQDENQGFVAFSNPAGDEGTWAVSMDYLWISNIQKRAGDTENPDSLFNNSNVSTALSYARRLSGERSFGLTLKHVRESLDTFQANSLALDAGFQCPGPWDGVSFGLVAENLGLNLGGDPLPILLKGGAAYRLLPNLSLAADVDGWVSDKRTYVDLGGEYRLMDAFALRAGYQIGRSQDNLGGATGLSAGLGLGVGPLSLDYAFLPFGDLGNTHRVSINLRF